METQDIDVQKEMGTKGADTQQQGWLGLNDGQIEQLKDYFYDKEYMLQGLEHIKQSVTTRIKNLYNIDENSNPSPELKAEIQKQTAEWTNEDIEYLKQDLYVRKQRREDDKENYQQIYDKDKEL
jgi:hypothetical protein